MTNRATMLAVAALLSASGCASNNGDDSTSDRFGWPECEEGEVAFGDRCASSDGLLPCELIDARGACPTGYHCEEGLGCVEGAVCGDVICAPGELCVDEHCTCTDGDPSTTTPDGPCPEGQICAMVMSEANLPIPACVAPTYDGDEDGSPIGDVDGDGRRDDCDDLDAEVGPVAEEVCDGVDNDCDGTMDEGFDADGDGYSACGYAGPRGDTSDPDGEAEFLYGPDCNDIDPTINPGAVDLCELGPDGALLDADCDSDSDSCPFGSRCCPGIEGCVHTDSDPNNCGSCGEACPELHYCVVGVCRDSLDTIEVETEEGVVVLEAEPGPANHPEVSWNWMRRSQWFSWFDWPNTHWFQFHWWELDYGLTWVQQTPTGHGVLLFDGRHFVSSPLNAIEEVGDSVESVISPLTGLTWYGTQILAVLDGENTIPSMAPAGGLGYGVAWSDNGGGGTQIYFAAVGEYGRPTGWSQQLTRGSASHLYPRLAWGPYYYYMGANYGMVYQREVDNIGQIYFQQVQSHWDWWMPFGVGLPVSNNEAGALNPDIAWSPFGYGVVYVGAEDSNLYFAVVGAFGGLLAEPTQITIEGNIAGWRPSLAYNEADGEFGIAFQATSPPADNQDIYFLRVSPYGAPLAPPVRLTSDRDLQRAPDMSWAGNGYGITWYDRRSGQNEIAFTFIDPEGAILEGPTMLTDHGGSGGGTNPAITHASVSDSIDGSTFSLFGWSGSGWSAPGEFGLVWRDEEFDGADPRVNFVRLTRSEE